MRPPRGHSAWWTADGESVFYGDVEQYITWVDRSESAWTLQSIFDGTMSPGDIVFPSTSHYGPFTGSIAWANEFPACQEGLGYQTTGSFLDPIGGTNCNPTLADLITSSSNSYMIAAVWQYNGYAQPGSVYDGAQYVELPRIVSDASDNALVTVGVDPTQTMVIVANTINASTAIVGLEGLPTPIAAVVTGPTDSNQYPHLSVSWMADDTLYQQLDDVVVSASLAPGTTIDDTSCAFGLGAAFKFDQGGRWQWFEGTITEVIIYPTGSAALASSVTAYLKTKYSLPYVPPYVPPVPPVPIFPVMLTSSFRLHGRGSARTNPSSLQTSCRILGSSTKARVGEESEQCRSLT